MDGKRRILVIDDDDSMAEFCAEALRLDGWLVRTASTGSQALRELACGAFQVVLTDYVMGPGKRSIIDLLKASERSPEVVVMTGLPSLETAMISFAEGARGYLTKPFSLDELLAAVQACLAPAPKRTETRDPETAWLREAMRDYFKSIRASREPPRMPAILTVNPRLTGLLYQAARELRREYGLAEGELR